MSTPFYNVALVHDTGRTVFVQFRGKGVVAGFIVEILEEQITLFFLVFFFWTKT